MDKIDRFLLTSLQQNAETSSAELAAKIGLSPSPCARRIRRLQSEGYITGIHAHVSPEKLGLDVRVFVHVRLSSHQDTEIQRFEQEVRSMDEVTSCHTVSGSFDYLLAVICSDHRGYEQWLRKLQRLAMVSQVDSSFAIRTVKVNGIITPKHTSGQK